jgi:hypothetical protein
MSWTDENYPAVREHLSEESREVFDDMAEYGLRLYEVVGLRDALKFRRRWDKAVKLAGVEPAPPEQMRNDRAVTRKHQARSE